MKKTYAYTTGSLGTPESTVAYTYGNNAWGKLLSVTDANGNAITCRHSPAILNSLRYRGYCYDTDTGLYYLQTRYYDPEVGRFLNADSYVSTGQGLFSCNMFAYCENDPVTFIDPSGMLIWYGEIHDQVVKHIANEKGFYKEQGISYSIGWGRTDLISSDGYIREVKPNKSRQISKGKKQLEKYLKNKWNRYEDTELKQGYEIEGESFLYDDGGGSTYIITYKYHGDGIITYEYDEYTFKKNPKIEIDGEAVIISSAIIVGVLAIIVASGGASLPAVAFLI